MKKLVLIFCVVAVAVVAGCGVSEEDFAGDSGVSEGSGPDEKTNILLITGEGGPSGAMFIKAAETYKKANGGEIYDVHSGDEFIAAIKDFYAKNGKIDHIEYFGHGNQIGLYVNQAANVNGGLYANDPALNVDYLAASIYEVEREIFDVYGWIKFNGCNVASGWPEVNSLAQSFANYFDVDVVAPRGPTEFSRSPNYVDPIPNTNFLDPSFAGEVYMVSTYSDKDFITVKPQSGSESAFSDVREDQDYYLAVQGLYSLGFDLGVEKGGEFKPYKNITVAEAVEFCEIFIKEKSLCKVSESSDELIRNLKALKLLTDAHEVSLKNSDPWHSSYIFWAGQNEILTRDFTTKKWYTRGEMAELTWNFRQHFAKGID
ncbi:MAG: S-layer homology domain-containing protein [Patescibacteria group bacterium]